MGGGADSVVAASKIGEGVGSCFGGRLLNQELVLRDPFGCEELFDDPGGVEPGDQSVDAGHVLIP